MNNNSKRNRFTSLILLFISLFYFSIFHIESISAQSSNSLTKIDQYIKSEMNKNNIPGMAVAITHKDKVILAKGYGKTSDQKQITATTRLPLASLSKSFTALAVMQLVEAGKINLDVPVAQYIPSFKLSDPRGAQITVRHLLNQTSGLNDTVYPDMTLKSQPQSSKEVIKNLGTVKLANDPGKKHQYHNPNYQILARLVEVVSKMDFSDYLRQYIFNPLDMKQSINVSTTAQLKEQANKVSQGHYLLFGNTVIHDEPEWFIDGAAGIISTADDMAKWLILQQQQGTYNNKQILSKQGIKKMQTPTSSTIDYGFGWIIGKTDDGKEKVSHGGILWTYKAEEWLLPEQEYGVVILFNSGLNAFIDYSSFTRGLVDLLDNKTPVSTFLTNRNLEIFMVAIIVLTILLGFRNLLRLKKWEEKYKNRNKYLSVLYLILRLIPLYLLLFLPKMMTLIVGGRVITLEGIYLTMPSIIIWLVIFSIFSLMIVITRVYHLYPIKTIEQQHKEIL